MALGTMYNSLERNCYIARTTSLDYDLSNLQSRHLLPHLADWWSARGERRSEQAAGAGEDGGEEEDIQSGRRRQQGTRAERAENARDRATQVGSSAVGRAKTPTTVAQGKSETGKHISVLRHFLQSTV